MKKLFGYLGGVFASMVATIILATMLEGNQPTLKNIKEYVTSNLFGDITVTIPFYVVIIAFFIIFLLVFHLRNKTLVEISHKNTKPLLVNTVLLEKLLTDEVPVIVRSTRFSDWTAQNTKTTTKSFRSILTQLSENENHEIRRLWVVRSKNDYKRLLQITHLYERHASTTIKFIYLEECPNIIETFAIGDKVATIGIPTGRHGATIGMSINTSNTIIIKAIQSYFDLLYSNARFALDKGSIRISQKEFNQ